MNLLVDNQDGTIVATVPMKFLDGSNDEIFKEDLFELAKEHEQIVLCLKDVDFIDSTGCGVILAAVKQLRGRGGDLKVCSITAPVRALFDLIGLRKVIDILPNEEDALRTFRGYEHSNSNPLPSPAPKSP